MRQTAGLRRPGYRGRGGGAGGWAGRGQPRAGPAGWGGPIRDWRSPQPTAVGSGVAAGGAELRAPPCRRGPIAAAEGWRADARAAVKLSVVRNRGCGPALWGRLRRDSGASGGKWRPWKAPGRERLGAAASLFAVKRETQLQFGPRLGRQRPHLAHGEGAELECLKGISAVGGNQHLKRMSPGPDRPAVSEGLGPELGAPGPLEEVLVAVWWLFQKRNSDSTDLPESSLLVPSPLVPSTVPLSGTVPGTEVPFSDQGAPGSCISGAKGNLRHSTAPEHARSSFRLGCPARWHPQRWLLLSLGSAKGIQNPPSSKEGTP